MTSTLPPSSDPSLVTRRVPPIPTPPLLPRLLAAAGALVVVTLFGVLLNRSSFDFAVTQAANHLHVGAFSTLTTKLYFLFDPRGSVLITVAITALVALIGLIRGRSVVRSLCVAGAYAVTVAVSWLPIAGYKPILDRPRPDEGSLPNPFTETQTDGSFPSGHTAFALVSVLAMTLIVAETRWARVVIGVLGGVWVVFMVLVVLSNGVHFPTDSALSVVWALGITPLVAAVAQRGAARICET